MGRWGRLFVVGTLALCGILLVVLGMGGLRELLVVGKMPPELLGRRVAYTTGSLGIGLGLIVWCLVAGIAWARSVGVGTAGPKPHSSDEGDKPGRPSRGVAMGPEEGRGRRCAPGRTGEAHKATGTTEAD
ncbi:MAG: hypothetical protein ACREKK_02445 [Candidatus Methylomirabilales bacterium]